MLIGFGCTVPAVMSTRTLPSDRDRRMTILLTPFMSCTAKLPIYGFFVNAFFPEQSWLIITALYLLGIPMLYVAVHEYARLVFPRLKLRPIYISRGASVALALALLIWGIVRNLPACSFLAPAG